MTPTAFVAARKRLGLTQRALADLLEVSPFTVSRWERAGGVGEIPALVASVMAALEDADPDKRGWLFHFLQERASLRAG